MPRVVLSDDELPEAYPRTTPTIEIESFVPAGEKVHALLRTSLRAASV
jgi:non-homologous end joining protein Ku